MAVAANNHNEKHTPAWRRGSASTDSSPVSSLLEDDDKTEVIRRVFRPDPLTVTALLHRLAEVDPPRPFWLPQHAVAAAPTYLPPSGYPTHHSYLFPSIPYHYLPHPPPPAAPSCPPPVVAPRPEPFPTHGLLGHHGFNPPRVPFEASSHHNHHHHHHHHYTPHLPSQLQEQRLPARTEAVLRLRPDLELTRVGCNPPSAATLTSSELPSTAATSTITANSPLSSSSSRPSNPRQGRRPRADDLVPPGCNLTKEDIVLLPIDDFNDKVADKTEDQQALLKDRRRRGKNRVSNSPFCITR